MLCTAVVNETRFICSNDGIPFLLTFYEASQVFFEAGVVAQRCFDPSLLLPQKKKLPCCLSHTTKCFKGQCLPAKAEGLVWFLSGFSLLLAMSFLCVCFPITSPVCFLASPFFFPSTPACLPNPSSHSHCGIVGRRNCLSWPESQRLHSVQVMIASNCVVCIVCSCPKRHEIAGSASGRSE